MLKHLLRDNWARVKILDPSRLLSLEFYLSLWRAKIWRSRSLQSIQFLLTHCWCNSSLIKTLVMCGLNFKKLSMIDQALSQPSAHLECSEDYSAQRNLMSRPSPPFLIPQLKLQISWRKQSNMNTPKLFLRVFALLAPSLTHFALQAPQLLTHNSLSKSGLLMKLSWQN